jgi:hypothetical protein
MLSLVVSTTLAFCSAQEPAAAPADEAIGQLAVATAEFAKAESYTFTSTSKTERPGGAEGRGGGGGEPIATTGTFKKGMPMLLVAGETTAYKQSDLLVNKNDAGAWEAFDPRSMWGGGGRGGGERGGGGMNRALFSMMRIRAPHEMLAGFEQKQATVEHAKEGELDVFTGKLTDKAAEGLGGGFGRRGGGGEMAVEGTYRVEVKAGKVIGASFTVQRSGDFGGRAFEMTTETALVFEKVGQTELEVPDEVLLLFSY